MSLFDTAYNHVQQLVAKFNNNVLHYMSPTYSEAEARQDFIDNFFIALGWDVTHQTQTNPYEQEVKIERSQKQQNESARKRADYAFFSNGNYKDEIFFVEAKKPSVLIQSQPQHYFQTIRYGWNAGCPISVLTDFEEFVIIDCRAKPDIKYALNGKHKSYRYTDYSNKEKFAEIYWLFSREAVAAGSIKKYADALPKAKGKVVQKALFKGGYQAIDDSFLEYIDGIRLNLAQAFKKNDESLDGEQLTEAVQRTVDRLVFIRFLEDKFIEAENHVNEWQSWEDFVTDCRKLDAKYNGVVFKKHFIDEQDFVGAEERLFVDICQDLSNYNSPYDFNYIPIHILGSIYERFLGKVIRTTTKRVFVEDKPEVRKAGGVYYTPKYIVDYIVQNTVGKQIEGKTPKQIAELHFADIACGSGSFLIGVYDCLLDYHKKYYLDKLEGKTELDKRSEDFGNVNYTNNQWILTLKLKQDILLNNVYGVDIDYQAVEVTQLSLFLKMLEDESLSSIGTRQGRLFAKVLPDLTKNIVCGNSLIGFDIMQMKGGLFENKELRKLNPLDYTATFPKILRGGGFDAIVGNPPYVNIFNIENEDERNYYRKKYKSCTNKVDLYAFFIEKIISILKRNGVFGEIFSNSWLSTESFKNFRQLIIEESKIYEIVKLPSNVFKDAVVTTIMLFSEKDVNEKNKIHLKYYEHDEFKSFPFTLDYKQIKNNENFSFGFKRQIQIKVLTTPLDDLVKFSLGIKTSNDKRFIKDTKENDDCYKLLRGKDFSRYKINYAQKYVWYRPDLMMEKVGAGPRKIDNFKKNKILIKDIAVEIIATLDNENYLTTDTISIVFDSKPYDIKFILGLLNSKFIGLWFNTNYEAGLHIKINQLQKIPIVNINLNNPQQKSQHDSIVNCVTQLLAAKQKLAQAKEGRDKDFLANQCNSLDSQIDQLVYQLYGLTNDDIKIIENA